MQIDYAINIDLSSTCEAIGLESHELIEIVTYGIIEPQGNKPEEWEFDLHMLSIARRAARLKRDLHLDWLAVALIVDLMEERDRLTQQNQALHSQLGRFLND